MAAGHQVMHRPHPTHLTVAQAIEPHLDQGGIDGVAILLPEALEKAAAGIAAHGDDRRHIGWKIQILSPALGEVADPTRTRQDRFPIQGYA